jgi:YD repeat-containing protein
MSIDPPGALPPAHYEYDAAGRVTRTTQKDDSGNDRVTDITRDWGGRIAQITYPEEGGMRLSASYTYLQYKEDEWWRIYYNWDEIFDDRGQDFVDVIDTNGVKRQYLYTWHGLLWMIIEDKGDGKANAVTTFEYDCFANLKKLIDANGNVTTFTYDSLDGLTAITDAEDNSTYYTYWPDGSLKTRTDHNGVLTEYTNNDDNRLVSGHASSVGYNLRSVMRASSVVNYQLTFASRLFR